jgi:hypothetical protein
MTIRAEGRSTKGGSQIPAKDPAVPLWHDAKQQPQLAYPTLTYFYYGRTSPPPLSTGIASDRALVRPIAHGRALRDCSEEREGWGGGNGILSFLDNLLCLVCYQCFYFLVRIIFVGWGKITIFHSSNLDLSLIPKVLGTGSDKGIDNRARYLSTLEAR